MGGWVDERAKKETFRKMIRIEVPSERLALANHVMPQPFDRLALPGRVQGPNVLQLVTAQDEARDCFV